jgi:hypothetical protein
LAGACACWPERRREHVEEDLDRLVVDVVEGDEVGDIALLDDFLLGGLTAGHLDLEAVDVAGPLGGLLGCDELEGLAERVLDQQHAVVLGAVLDVEDAGLAAGLEPPGAREGAQDVGLEGGDLVHGQSIDSCARAHQCRGSSSDGPIRPVEARGPRDPRESDGWP